MAGVILLFSVAVLSSAFEKPWGNYLLEDFVETVAPEPVSWWPATQGWWLVLLLVLVAVATRVYGFYQEYKANVYRRQALAWLNHQLSQGIEVGVLQIPALLKRVALEAFDREEVAELSGVTWEKWLDEQCDQTDFSGEYTAMLARVAYQKNAPLSQTECRQLIAQTRLWIVQHRRPHD